MDTTRPLLFTLLSKGHEAPYTLAIDAPVSITQLLLMANPGRRSFMVSSYAMKVMDAYYKKFGREMSGKCILCLDLMGYVPRTVRGFMLDVQDCLNDY